MKKLLTIVAVALILCLGLSVLASGETHDFRAQYNGDSLGTQNGVPIIDDTKEGWEKALLDPANWKFVDNGQSPDLPGSDDMESADVVKKVSLMSLFVASANAEANDDAPNEAPRVLRAYIVESTRSIHGKMTIIMVLGENNYSAEAYVWLKSNMHVMDEYNIEIGEDGYCHKHPVCLECGEYGEWGEEYHDPNFVKKNADGVLECLKCHKTFAGDDWHEHKGVVFFEDMPNCKNGVLTVVSYYRCSECYKTLEKEKVDGMWKVIEGADQYATAPESQQIVWESATACINKFVELNPTYYVEDENPQAKGTYNLAMMRRNGDYDDNGHLWGKYVKFQDATCYANAREVRICWLCETTQEREIPNTQLKPDFTAQAIKCNSNEEVTLVCNRCEGKAPGHTVVLDQGVNSGAKFDAVKDSIILIHDINLDRAPDEEVKPTCTKSGYQKWNCHNEGCITNESRIVYLNELGHDFEGSEWINLSPADKDKNIRGWWSRKCTRCNTTEDYFGFVVPCDEHDYYTVPIVKPTCTEEGLNGIYCTGCDYYEEEIVPTVDHMPASEDDYILLKWPGCVEGEEGEQAFRCKWCGNYITEEIEPLGHPEEYWETTEAVEPTCATMGCSEGIYCTWCGGWVVEPEWYDFDLDNHEDAEIVYAVEPTCENVGYEFWQCNVCGAAWIVDYDALGHNFCYDEEHEEFYVVVSEPTTEDEGIIWHYCENGCGEYEEEIVPVLPAEAEYEVTELDYYPDDLVAVGKVEPTTEGEAFDMWARVAFYLPSGDCMIQMVKVDEDGYFVAGASGNFNHISVIIVRVPVAYDPDVAIENLVCNDGKPV